MIRYAIRLNRLEALKPKGERRVILVWIDKEGRRTKVADTMPDLPDHNHYDHYMTACGRNVLDSGWRATDAAQTT